MEVMQGLRWKFPEFKEYCRSLRKVETLIYSKVNKNSMATKLKQLEIYSQNLLYQK